MYRNNVILPIDRIRKFAPRITTATTTAASAAARHTHTHIVNRAAVLVFGVIVFGEPVLLFFVVFHSHRSGAHFGSYNYFKTRYCRSFGRLVCYILKLIVCLSEIIVKINKKMRANKRASLKTLPTYTNTQTQIHIKSRAHSPFIYDKDAHAQASARVHTHTHTQFHVEPIEN